MLKKGPWREWVDNHALQNILQSDNTSVSNATCFLNPSNPSPIDWILATSRIGSTNITKASILPNCVLGSVHKPISIEIDAAKFLDLADTEMINACRAPMKAHSLRGKEDGPFVTKFRELHDVLWEESEAQGLMELVNGPHFDTYPTPDKHKMLEDAYTAVTRTFTVAISPCKTFLTVRILSRTL